MYLAPAFHFRSVKKKYKSGLINRRSFDNFFSHLFPLLVNAPIFSYNLPLRSTSFPISQRHGGGAKLDIPTSKMSCWYNTHCPNTLTLGLETEKFVFSQITADHSNHMDKASEDDFNTGYYGRPSSSFLKGSTETVQPITVTCLTTCPLYSRKNISQMEGHTFYIWNHLPNIGQSWN
jgi:hypothetical protein